MGCPKGHPFFVMCNFAGYLGIGSFMYSPITSISVLFTFKNFQSLPFSIFTKYTDPIGTLPVERRKYYNSCIDLIQTAKSFDPVAEQECSGWCLASGHDDCNVRRMKCYFQGNV